MRRIVLYPLLTQVLKLFIGVVFSVIGGAVDNIGRDITKLKLVQHFQEYIV